MSRASLLVLQAALCAALPLGAQVITTLAGADWVFPGDGKPAINAPLGGPLGFAVAADRKGNFFLADGDNRMVMQVGPDGVIHVIAGNGVMFFSGDGGPAVSASLAIPLGVAVDSAGNVFIADLLGYVRMINPAGIISTVAGNGTNDFTGDGGPAAAAAVTPVAIAVDSSGAVYILDNNTRVRKFTPGGNIATVAGNGQIGYTGDGGRAVSASFNGATGVAVDSNGNIYISDTNNFVIRKVTPAGIISTFAGGGFDLSNGIPATQSGMIPISVGVDPANNVYIGDFFFNTVRKVTTDGRIQTIAGSGVTGFFGDEGKAVAAQFNYITGVVGDVSGNVYIADSFNNRIRKITTDGNIHTAAGNGQYRTSGDGGPAISAALYLPTGVATDRSGNIYIAEQQHNRIRRVSPGGTISNFAGNGKQGYSGDGGAATNATMFFPTSLTTDAAGNLFISEALNSVVRRVSTSGVISTVAGNGTIGFSGDAGFATAAMLAGPAGIAIDASGNLFIADSGNQRIRMVTAAGRISTVAGTGTKGFSGDGGAATSAAISGPTGLAVDSAGNVYFSDNGNQRVRRFKPGGTIATVAGSGKRGYSGDGGTALNASFDSPQGVALDAAGNLFISDSRNVVVRKVTPGGIISTAVGSGFSGYGGDGGSPANAMLSSPYDLAFDTAGDLLIADLFNHRIRAVLTSKPSFSVSPSNLSFSTGAGTAAPALNASLTTSVPGLAFAATVSTVSGGSWLQVSPTLGPMPAVLRVVADASSLGAGSYQGKITIIAPNANPTTQSIDVTLDVGVRAAPNLSVKPNALAFAFIQQSAPSSQALTVSNQGGGSLSFTATATTGVGSWLSVSPTSGSDQDFGSVSLNVTATPGNLSAGTYTGSITVSSPDTRQSIVTPVVMTITAVQQTILLTQRGLTFTAIAGASAQSSQSFGIKNTGRGLMQWSAQASTISGGGWLAVSPASGASDASATGVPQVLVTANPTGLGPGTYYGQVKVTAPAADNSPQSVSVNLTVLPAGSTPGPVVQPTALLFTAVAGGSSPGSQTVQVSDLASAAVNYTSGQTTEDGRNWFVTLPPGANVTRDQPVRIVIQPNTSGLAAGVYRGTLSLAFSDGNSRTVTIVLVLVPPAGGSTKTFREAQSSCVPKKLIPLFTAISDGFQVPAAYPNQLNLRVVDDCANPMLTGSNVASFSNGDVPLTLTSQQDGSWTTTWVSHYRTGQVTVTANSEIVEQNLRGSTQVSLGLQTNTEPPFIESGGILNSASYQLQSPLSPGTLVSIFGTKLSTAQNFATSVPLPTSLGDTLVAIGGQPVPLLYTSDGQINAALPYGLATNTSLQIAITRGGTLTVPEPLTIAPASPGVFTQAGNGIGQGLAFVQNPDFTLTLADAAHPAKAGDALVIYCTGLGEVDPTVKAGNAAPVSPLSMTKNPVTATIGGVNAPVFFAGLAPGFVGLYQVNAVVPAGAKSGADVPLILTVAGQSSPPVTVAIR